MSALAVASEKPAQLKISAPRHPNETVVISIHGCEGGLLVSKGALIVPFLVGRLDQNGKLTMALLIDEKDLHCNWVPGVTRTVSYGVQIAGTDKEKTIKVRTGKTAKVKL